MSDEIYLGIDFGTCTNYVTKWDSKKKTAIPVTGITKELGSNNFFENIIYYESLKNHILGKHAFNKGITEPMNVVEGIKRKIELDNWKQRIPSIGKEISAIEVTTDIFRKIKERVEEINGGTPVVGSVISVPFAFQHKERQKIKKAAENAGLNVLKLIEEPVAAAICYGVFKGVIEDSKKEKILIFDLGGGTFDVTIFDLIKKEKENIFYLEVLNTDGHKALGGRDIDDMLLKKFEEYMEQKLSDIRDEKQRIRDQFELIKTARELKENLSLSDEENAFCAGLDGGKKLDMDIIREQFNEWVKGNGFISKIKEILENTLDDIDLKPSNIDRIILVGGTSNIPLIQMEIEKFFGKKAESIKNPGELVGEGAGIYCGSLLDDNLSYEIITKISHSIGVKTAGGKFNPLIQKNSKYETFSDIKVFTVGAIDRRKKIEVYQGNSSDISKCSFVGKIEIDGENLPGSQIGIQLGTDKDGIVRYKLCKVIPFEEGEFSG